MKDLSQEEPKHKFQSNPFTSTPHYDIVESQPNNEYLRKQFIKTLRKERVVLEDIFIVGCGLTESNNYNIKEFGADRVFTLIDYLTREVSPAIDGLKKGLFYGSDNIEKYLKLSCTGSFSDEIGIRALNEKQRDLDNEAYNLTVAEQDKIRMLHCALGIITEGFELLEEVFESIVEPRNIDWIHVFEEIYDADWYKTISHRVAARAIKEDWESVGINSNNPAHWRANLLRKLIGKRYPEGKFDTEAQENRDTNNEREALEGNE